MRTLIASLALSSLVALAPQQGMIPVIDTKPASTAPACPVLWALPMNEGSGTTFNDTSGSANNVTISTPATVTWTANAIKSGETAPFFNGGTGGLIRDTGASNINFPISQPFTVALWVNRGSATGDLSFISDLNVPLFFNGWEVGQNSGGGGRAIFFLVSDANASKTMFVTGTNTIPTTLTYLVFTYDGSGVASGVKIYMNGVLETNVVLTNSLAGGSVTSANARNLSRRQDGSLPFTGPMGYIEVSSCVWNQAKISANFAGGPAIN